MSDVFISYSRKDNAFVRRLTGALESQRRQVWVDWEDIPRGVEWLDEIFAGIEGAHTFVFVVSPDSLASRICNVEIAHAFKHQKRIVPLILRDIDEKAIAGEWFNQEWEQIARDNWKTLRTINWLNFRSEDDFETEFKVLSQTLDSDPDHVHAHTRLLVRAVEWDTKGRDDSLLLRGRDLAFAETWLALAVGKQPAPTTLQNEYISAGRTSAVRRQRVLLGGVSLALVVAVALSALSFGLYQQSQFNLSLAQQRGTEAGQQAAAAEANAATAIHRGAVAQALALAAQAQLELNGPRQERAALLALEALEHFPYTWQAERALAAAIQDSRLRLLFDVPTWITTIAWSPDGKRLATTGADNTLVVLDAGSREEVQAFVNPNGKVVAAAWSPDGQHIAVGSDTGLLTIWDIDTREQLISIQANFPVEQDAFGYNPDAVNSIAWSPDGALIATAGGDKAVHVWDTATGAEAWSLIEQPSVVNGVAWSPDGTQLATAGQDGALLLWDAVSGAPSRALIAPETPPAMSVSAGVIGVAWSPDGKWLAAGIDTQPNNIRIFDAASGAQVAALTQDGHTKTVLAWAPDAQRLAVGTARIEPIGGRMRVWDVPSGAPVLALLDGTAISAIAWSPDGRWLATGGSSRYESGTVAAWDVGTPMLVAELPLGSANGAAWSPDGTRLASVSGDGRAQFWDASSAAQQLSIDDHTDMLREGAWSPDSARLATISLDGRLWIWDAESGANLLMVEAQPPAMPTSAAWSPDGAAIVVSYQDASVLVWNVASGAVMLDLRGHSDWVNDAAWSPDGTRIATASDDGTVRLWDAETGRQQLLIEADQLGVNVVAWSPDGVQLASGGNSSTAHVWNATSGERIVRLQGHTHGIYSMDWSPNGARLATGSDDGSTRIWDVGSGAELINFRVNEGPLHRVTAVDWSPDGAKLAATAVTVRIWRVWQSPAELTAYARECCALRALTDAERALFGLPPP